MQDVVDRIMADDRAGQIARRLLYPYLNHAATMPGSGYATAADIDAAMVLGCGYPVGPLTLVDALGVETVAEGLRELQASTGDPLHEPAPALRTPTGPLSDDPGGDEEVRLRRTIETVGVVGTGTMAAGIAEVFLVAGYPLVLVGREQDRLDTVVEKITAYLDKAVSRSRLDETDRVDALDRLTVSTERPPLADADIVIEAIVEDLDVKQELFTDLDRLCRPGAILATTTSSLSIARCAAATRRPADVLGMHFFNPAPLMKLVEVVSTDQTVEDVSETVRALCLEIGKQPVSCTDRAGFIVNALLFPYLNDAVLLHETQDISPAEIDEAMKATGLPLGPFELLDVVGTDVSLAIQRTLAAEFGHAGWAPAAGLENAVAEGRLGRKSGRGFHSY